MSKNRWSRRGNSVRSPDGRLWLFTDWYEGKPVNVDAVAVDRLMVTANKWLAHEAFVEAAKEAMKKSLEVQQEGMPIGYWVLSMQSTVAALALLPAPPEPSPTLAEQGEEIKKFIGKMYVPLPFSKRRIDELKAMVDALVAGKQEVKA